MKDNKEQAQQEKRVIELLQTTELTCSAIGKEVGLTRQKVTRIKSRFIKEGLGDKVQNFTDATGISTLVKSVFGEDCGCNERKERLNALRLSNLKVQKCLTNEQYNYLDRFFSTWNGYSLPYETLDNLAKIRNTVFSLRYTKPNPTCNTCVRGIINPLKPLYEAYKNELTPAT